jgi:release factor glutamine methyltransferase
MASSQNQKTTSLKKLILENKEKASIDELDQLMALALHKNIEYIYKNPDKKLSRANILTFKKLLNKRLANYSLAYLKKNKEFFNLNFIVSKHTLVPRPDSELLVTEALKNSCDNQNIIDIGTGSGVLILSLAKNNKHQANYTATDISTKALDIAKTNSRKLKLKNNINFIKSNLLNNIDTKFDIVIANLPYLTPLQMQEVSITKEPRTALVSGKNGLDHYKKLLKQLPKYLNKKYLILLEIDPAQEKAIKKEIESNLPKAKINFLKDLANNIRVVKISQ